MTRRSPPSINSLWIIELHLRIRIAGLWRDPDFLKPWTARTVSQFGTLMGALQFTGVLVLGASRPRMGTLGAAADQTGAAILALSPLIRVKSLPVHDSPPELDVSSA